MRLYKQDISDRHVGSWRYALGVIASRENSIISVEDRDRLFNAETKQDFDRIRTELGYGGADLSTTLELARAEDIDLLASLMPESKFLRVLLLENDLHNLKSTVKATLLADNPLTAKEIERLYLAPYTIEPGVYQLALKGEFTDLADDFKQVIQQATEAWSNSYNAAKVDQVIDCFYWHKLLAALADLKNDFLNKYYVAKRDLINLESLLRAYQLGMRPEVFQTILITEGSLTHQRLINWLREGKQVLLQDIEFTDYHDLSEVVENYGQSGSASAFLAAVDNHLMRLLKSGNSMVAGPERVLVYFFAREQERKNLELARIAIVNNLSEKRIAEIKREVL